MQQDREEVAQLLARGFTQGDIAKKQERSQQMVAHDWKMWLKNARQSTEEDRQEAIHLCNYQIKELSEAWEKSKEAKKSKQKKMKGSRPAGSAPGTAPTVTDYEESNKEEEIFGDASYMAAMSKVADRKCRLLGLFQDKLEVEQRGQVHVYIPDNERGDRHIGSA